MRTLTIAFLAALAASPAAAQADLVGSKWVAEDILGRGVVDRVQSTLQLLAGRQVAGSGGCNQFGGKGVFANGKIEIGDLVSTQMACPPAVLAQESSFMQALAASKRYEIGRDGLLRFYDARGNATLRFSRLK